MHIFVVSKFYWYWLFLEVVNKRFFQFVCPEEKLFMACAFHLFEAIKTNIDQTPFREQHGESVGKFLISSKIQVRSLAFVTFCPFLNLRLKTHLTEMHDWLGSSSSQYSSCFFQSFGSFFFSIFA